MGSKKFTLDFSDLSKVFKTAVLVGGAAALTVVAENLEVVDIGMYTPLFVPIIAVGLDTAIKWLKNNSKNGE
tara:strand:- start:1277 stop:1492 length:216 start_codon:yes stop_codon:yes gene_type:complete